MTGKVVLVVDDSEQDLALIEEACREIGCKAELRAAADGPSAMGYLEGRGGFADRKAHPIPSLMLLDLQMPGMSGFEVLTWLRSHRENWRRVPVVVLTAAPDDREIRKAYDLGANSFIVKPSGFVDLCKVLAQTLPYWLERNRALT